MNEIEFRKKLNEINISPKEVSILLEKEYFEGENIKKEFDLKGIMFLGLNRSNPRDDNKDFHNMHEAIDFLLKDAELKKHVEGAYLSDFFKVEIFERYIKNEERNYSSGKRFIKELKNLGDKKYKEILDKSKEILDKEIKQFEIKTIFCWGWDGGYDTIRRHSETKPCAGSGVQKMFTYEGKDYVYLSHYSKSNAKINKTGEIIKQVNVYLQKTNKTKEKVEVKVEVKRKMTKEIINKLKSAS